ncbi:hypothetical protein PHISCL_11009, partial [Aspergillus sclerotialis]
MRVIVADYSDSYVPDNAIEADSEDEYELEMDECGMWTSQEKLKVDTPSEENDGPVNIFDFRMPAYMGR